MAQKTYTGISPILVPENEKVVSIAFPSKASSIISLDIPETATIDVSVCSDDFIFDVLKTTTNIKTLNNKIYYRATSKIRLYSTHALPTITSHEFNDGKGVITFATKVTSIGNAAFLGCDGLTSITIPDSVTSIGSSTFSSCNGLTSITIPNGVTSIGDNAFGSCSGLTSITIPNGVTSIGDEAFRKCSSLTSITIPDSVTSIGQYAFQNCSGLTSINVSEGNTKYDSRNNCNAIIETATNILLYGCQNTIIPDNVTSIGARAFYECKLTSINIPDSVTSIGDSAFDSCSGLTSVSIGNGVNSIGSQAFFSCSRLTSVSIGNGVKSVGDYAFGYCSITSITIPDSVTSIGDYAFENCYRLTSIIFNGTAAQWTSIIKGVSWDEGMPSNYIIQGIDSINYSLVGVNDRTVNYNVTNTHIVFYLKRYKNGILLGSTEYHHDIILDGVNDTYSEKANQIRFDVLDGLSYKGLDSDDGEDTPVGFKPLYANCTIYQKGKSSDIIYTANYKQYINESAFPSITSHEFDGKKGIIKFESPLTNIGNYAFDDCDIFTITIPDSVTSIGNWAFNGCSGLTSIQLSSNLTSIGNGAFERCSGLTSITIPEGVTSIGSSVFYNCSKLTSITFKGTTAQWSTITKGSNWNYNVRNVYCTDGTISI